MKTIILCFIASLILISCSENQVDLKSNQDMKLNIRTVSDVAYLYDGFGDNRSYNQLTGETEITVDSAFEYKPYGTSNWIPCTTSHIKVKLKCKCSQDSSQGGCNNYVLIDGDDVTVACDDPCTAGCKMHAKISNAAGGTIDEFDHGGEFRYQ